MPFLIVDGVRLPAEPGDTFLEAMQRASSIPALSCYAGDCGACKCEYVSGAITELEDAALALSPSERARHIVLGCRTEIWGDVQIRSIYDAERVVHPSRALHCRVSALDELTHDIKRFRLTVEAGGPFEFSAGQYAKVTFAPEIHREDSMANPPHDPGLEFHVRRTANGLVSNHVYRELAIGDGVGVEGPLGSCYLRTQHQGPILLAGGGSGMAPMQSILESALHLGMTQPIRLYFGVRELRDVYGAERLAELAARHPNFRFGIVLSSSGVEVADAAAAVYRSGMLHEVIAEDWPQLEVGKAYLAGPPVMVEAVSNLLRERGVALRDIHADAYYTEAEKAKLQPAHATPAGFR